MNTASFSRPLAAALLPLLISSTGPLFASDSGDLDFSRPEAGEHLPGGQATHRKKRNRDAFSQSSANMRFEDELKFKIGNGFFKRLWVTAPSSTQASDGLGPLYNARACQRCHLKDGRGHPPPSEGSDDNAVSFFLRLSVPPRTDEDRAALADHRQMVTPEPTYGGQLQDFAIPGHRAEGQVKVRYAERLIELADGTTVSLRQPEYIISDLGYGPMAEDVMTSPRVAPAMIGLGLLELIPEADILALADPDDRNKDGISGKAQQTYSQNLKRVALGRFGWKAGMATIDEQNQAAFAGDIGISTPLHPNGFGECTQHQHECRTAPDGNSEQYEGLEAHKEVTDLVLTYARNLALPMRRDAADTQVLQGKRVFHQAGCAQCHTPSFTTGNEGSEPHLRNQHIWPYTDLLLHDMGEGLADNRPEGLANGREWRTAPLWGIGATEVVSGHTNFLHDGRARNLLEAILWHGGEAEASRDHVISLGTQDREALIRFLESM